MTSNTEYFSIHLAVADSSTPGISDQDKNKIKYENERFCFHSLLVFRLIIYEIYECIFLTSSLKVLNRFEQFYDKYL